MTTVQNPKVSSTRVPVDVEFESLLRELSPVCEKLHDSPEDVQLQKDFCHLLRECKIVFEKIVDTYGKRYRGGEGAQELVEMAERTMAKFDKQRDEKILDSINRHYRRIVELQRTTYH